MPVLAFASLIWIDWWMAVAMFAALPLALCILWVSTSVQKKLSGSQVQAKINAGSRFEEYLQGIRAVSYTHLDVYKRQQLDTLHTYIYNKNSGDDTHVRVLTEIK